MEFLWTAPDGVTFPCERWLPTGNARAVVVCIHGLSGAAVNFVPLGEMGAARGIATFAINLRGQGNDPILKRRGAQLDLAQIERDLAAFGAAAVEGSSSLPVFWCGESMGALLLSHLIVSGLLTMPVAGAIFSVPVVELQKPTPRIIRELLRWLSSFIPDVRLRPSLFVNGRTGPLKITRDEEHAARIPTMPHHIHAFTLGFLNSFGDMMDKSLGIAGKITVPCLVMAAGNDVFIRVEQIERWFANLAATDKTLRIYPESYHLLWHDWDSEQVLGEIAEWLETRISRG